MKDSSKVQDVVNKVKIDNQEDQGDTIQVLVRLDLSSVKKAKFGRGIDGADYRTNYWGAILDYDKETEEITVDNVFYLTSEGTAEYKPGLSNVELEEITDYILENIDN